MSSVLRALGLHRAPLRAWVLYDWANSGMAATIVTAVFPTYYYKVAGAGLGEGVATQRFAITTTIALAIVAIVAPTLGTLADRRAARKRFLAACMALGVASTAAMFCIQTGDWLLGSVLFALANIGASGSLVFYDALLPHVARPEEIDRVSTAGYALGYLGGGLLLGLNLAWIQFPERFGLPSGTALGDADVTLPTRLAFVSVAVWWLVFSLPLLRTVREPPARGNDRTAERRGVGGALLHTLRDLRRHPQAAWMLLAFLIYNDGVLTIIRMSAIYGSEIGLPTQSLIVAILLVNFVGVPCGFVFGWMAGRIGAKRALYIALVAFTVISFLGYRLSSEREFLVLGILVGMFLGGTQALSRSLFASMIPKHKSSEFFALFAVAEKFAGIFGPALFTAVATLGGSSRAAILSIGLFFGIGGLLLRRVDVEAGRIAARASEHAAALGPEA